MCRRGRETLRQEGLWAKGVLARDSGSRNHYKGKGRKMQARGYFLNVAGLDAMEEAVLKKIDQERLKKLESMHLPEKRKACAGAGLLIQWAVLEKKALLERQADQEMQGVELLGGKRQEEEDITLQELSLTQLVEALSAPISLAYIYGKRGKPYFRDVPLFFNLSHSGDYVACVVSEHEVGVDIQKQKAVREQQISNRFFHEKEKEWLAGLSEKERTTGFFQLWTRKEAYGKMTGEGIVDAAGRDFSALDAQWLKGTLWMEYSLSEGYTIACCMRDEEKGKSGNNKV